MEPGTARDGAQAAARQGEEARSLSGPSGAALVWILFET